MMVVYYFAYHVCMLFLLPIFLFKMWKHKKYRSGLKQRFGILPADLLQSLKNQRVLWIHAVSVGEVQAAVPLIKRLAEDNPHYKVLVTTTTHTGQQVAHERLSDLPVEICYFPLDFYWVVRKVLKAIDPKVVLIFETELWPAFLQGCFDRKIPVLMVNGRISERSFRGYQIISPFIRSLLTRLSFIAVQTKEDERRIRTLGAPVERIAILGNMKFDLVSAEQGVTKSIAQSLASLFEKEILIAGSTHRGEEEILLNSYKALRLLHPSLILLLAPRHLERIVEVQRVVRQHGFSPVLRSGLPTSLKDDDVLILDTMGELAQLYQLATVVFIGKSLVGGGGQNPLEPAVYGKPVVIGSSVENFASICNELLRDGGLKQISSSQELTNEIDQLLRSPDLRNKIGKRALETIRRNKGATDRTLSLVSGYLLPNTSDSIISA